ncbi:DUF2635 domain-containing protein [Rhodopseudomonas sp. BR0G17]|uniref:DUF2635 domain-containing protein n=1 Tax=Rhodopseudomonas sp. BR0G17 TaxID=2269368 RepID=UPI0013DF017B|nr:DUF2635 domain-containing protein [Rhodopseudomonas sp. BR0G17]NEW96642.1 DUF2635 domain-containing protein [Rhodopseudomonas sp. BR0G17]
MQNFFIKPRTIDGAPALVRDPLSGLPLDPAGDHKPRSPFWIRRLRDGDVIEAQPAAEPAVITKPGD